MKTYSLIVGRGRWINRAFAAALVLAILPIHSAHAFRNVGPGAAIPKFSASDLSGTAHGLEDLAGKPAVIVFISGNDRSKKVMDEVVPFAQKYKEEGLFVMAVYVGSDKNEAKTMAEASKADFPVLLDGDKAIYGAFGVAVTPVMAIVDKNGNLIKEQAYVPLLGGVLDIEIKVALGKMTREDADLALKPEEAPQTTESEKEADKIYSLGLILLEKGMKDKAIEKFKKVLEVDPAYCKVRLQLGQLYLEQGNIEEAKAEFEYILKCDPQSHESKVGLGMVYAAKGDFDKALEMFESSLKLNPYPELAYYEMGKVYEKKQQLDKAVENYKKALEKLLSK